MFIPQDVRAALPSGWDADFVTGHVTLRSGLDALLGETHLVLHQGDLAVLTRESVLGALRLVELDPQSPPRLEPAQWESLLVLTVADGGVKKLKVSSLEVKQVDEMLAAAGFSGGSAAAAFDDPLQKSEAPAPSPPPAAPPTTEPPAPDQSAPQAASTSSPDSNGEKRRLGYFEAVGATFSGNDPHAERSPPVAKPSPPTGSPATRVVLVLIILAGMFGVVAFFFTRYVKKAKKSGGSKVAMLQRGDTSTRLRALKAIAESRDLRAVPAVIEALEDREHVVRRLAASTLGQLADRRAIDGLISALRDRDQGVRKEAAFALAQWPDANIVEALLSYRRTQRDYLGRPIVQRLIKHRQTHLIPLLLTLAVDHRDQPLEEVIIDALKKFGDDALPHLVKAMKSKRLAQAALTVLAAKGNRGVAGLLIGVRDSDKTVRSRAAEALAKMDHPSIIPTLLEALRDPVSEVRAQAIRVLVKRAKDPRVRPALIAALGDLAADVRAAAVRALGTLGNAGAALVPRLKDADWRVRVAAAEALSSAKGPAIDAALIAAAGDAEWNVRRAVATALGERATANPAALEVIKRLVAKDPHLEVRKAAIAAFAKSRGPTPKQPPAGVPPTKQTAPAPPPMR